MLLQSSLFRIFPESHLSSEEPEGWSSSLGSIPQPTGLGGFLKHNNRGGFVEPENLGSSLELAGWPDSLALSLSGLCLWDQALWGGFGQQCFMQKGQSLELLSFEVCKCSLETFCVHKRQMRTV